MVHARVFLCILAVAATLTSCGATDAESAKTIVGMWERSMKDALGQSNRMVWEFRDDGTYTYHDAAFGNGGTYKASDGAWSTKVTEGRLGMDDKGAYSFKGGDALVLTGKFGTTTWTRVQDGVYLVTEEIGGQEIPKGLPIVVTRVLADLARPWQADAIPVNVEIDQLPYGPLTVEIRFYSPSTGGGMRVELQPFKMSSTAYKTVNWGTAPIPADFMDLPEVVRIARKSGVSRPLESGLVREWEKGRRAWTLTFGGKGVVYDAVFGRPITEPLTSYVADYNAGWEKAVEGLKKFFPQRSNDGWDWGYDDDDSSSLPSWCDGHRYEEWRRGNFVGHC